MQLWPTVHAAVATCSCGLLPAALLIALATGGLAYRAKQQAQKAYASQQASSAQPEVHEANMGLAQLSYLAVLVSDLHPLQEDPGASHLALSRLQGRTHAWH